MKNKKQTAFYNEIYSSKRNQRSDSELGLVLLFLTILLVIALVI